METIRISWSSLRTYVECKQKAKLMRTGRKAALEDQRNFLPGTITDRISRDWLKDKDRQPGQMLLMLDEYFERAVAEAEESGIVRWKSVDDREKVRADCAEAITNLEPILLEHVTPYWHDQDVKFEVPMHAARNGGGDPIHVTLNGYMDYLVHDEEHDRWYVFDLKQTRNADYWKKTQGQMVYYSVATELRYGGRVEGAALIQPLLPEKHRLKPIEIGPEARLALFRDITNMANDVVNDAMPPKDDTDGCAWCPVKHACEKFLPEPGTRRMRLPGGTGLD